MDFLKLWKRQGTKMRPDVSNGQTTDNDERERFKTILSNVLQTHNTVSQNVFPR